MTFKLGTDYSGSLNVSGSITTIGSGSTINLGDRDFTQNEWTLYSHNNIFRINSVGDNLAINWTTGAVGIGTISSSLFSGQTGGSKWLTLSGGGGNAKANLEFQNASPGVGASLGSIIWGSGSNALAYLDCVTDGSTGSAYFALGTQHLNGGLIELFRINSIGNVGIGTTSPGSLLTVGSSTTFSVSSSGNTGIGIAPQNNVILQIYNTGSLSENIQYGLAVQPTFTTTATSTATVIYGQVITAPSLQLPTSYGLFIDTPMRGAGSTITSSYAIYIANQTGATTNYLIGSPNFGVTNSGAVILGQGSGIGIRSDTNTNVSVPNNTSTAIYTMPSISVNGEAHIITWGGVTFSGGGWAMIVATGADWVIVTQNQVSSGGSVAISGNAVDLTQTTGGTQTVTVRVLHIA